MARDFRVEQMSIPSIYEKGNVLSCTASFAEEKFER